VRIAGTQTQSAHSGGGWQAPGGPPGDARAGPTAAKGQRERSLIRSPSAHITTRRTVQMNGRLRVTVAACRRFARSDLAPSGLDCNDMILLEQVAWKQQPHESCAASKLTALPPPPRAHQRTCPAQARPYKTAGSVHSWPNSRRTRAAAGRPCRTRALAAGHHPTQSLTAAVVAVVRVAATAAQLRYGAATQSRGWIWLFDRAARARVSAVCHCGGTRLCASSLPQAVPLESATVASLPPRRRRLAP
jgi:hypothetical protein